MAAPLEFFFDFMSPFTYLAHRRVAAMARLYERKLRYVPIDLTAAKRAAGNTGPANRDIPVKLRYLMTDIQRWAALEGLPVIFPASLDSRRMNIGTLFAVARGEEERYIAECFTRGWGGGADIGADETLKAVASTMQWPAAEFLDYLAAPESQEEYRLLNSEAHTRGVFGVPTILIGEEMWWGNDRLQFVETYLQEQQA